MSKFQLCKTAMSSKKKGAPLPASSGGLMRFFEDETKGFKVDPKIVVSVPISLIVASWLLDIFLFK
ncbi:Preprotein translocase subunit SecG [metagenome]